MFDPEFSLDRYNLEIESERQAELMRKYSKRQARMKSMLKKAQRNLDILEGELAEEYRRNKKLYGIMNSPEWQAFLGRSHSLSIFSVALSPCPVKTETINSLGRVVRTYLVIPAIVAAEVGSM